MSSMEKKENRRGYMFMSPWIIGFIIFTLVPFVTTIYLSFTSVTSTIKGFEITYVGLENYYTAFFKNTEFLPALIDFIGMIVPYTFVVVIVSFIIAIMLNSIYFGRGIFRMIYFLPVIIMSGPVMYQILDTESAIEGVRTLEEYTDIFILQMISSYSPAIGDFLAGVFKELTVILWFAGIPIVLFINGLQKISPAIYEAAKIDSANAWQILWKITIPIIKPIMLVATIFTIAQIGTYEGNPVYLVITEATGNMSSGLGYAATYAWVYSIIILILIGASFLIFKESVPERRNL
ncbi:hypothetical protein AN639_01575 [Candidatus Epulonipiscium fishelsonii]|uniref:Uncharacterized protein n=1 Tax=Candidatus Epulonipiscium fishelsonii TaxID=77094 RepID=A0ACC8XBC3_9FIRM|nr:hypothetical protein AN639_01575 [Epulopiscium sp. SCG-B05WGA-EpuloA1]ONI39709.1 hypothetical protein AN396_07505 [Epulopiscium sp. SCG-B11WGA-EpuloA1]